MKQRLLIPTFVLGTVVLGAILVYSVAHRDPLFRGRPESLWISQISYSDDSQIKVWREFGPDGVRVLVRGLQKANHPIERGYRQMHRTAPGWLPSAVMRLLPNPRQDSTRSTRMCIVQVLARLGNDAAIATPAMVRVLRDEATGVRQLAITFFTASEDENTVLSHMEAKRKRRLLPDFIRAIGDSDWGLRNNAAIALGYYREQREIVAPILIKALHDPQNDVRLVAAKSLNRVAPERAVDAGVVSMLVEILKNPDDQVAYRAAELLGDFGRQPELTVPALVAVVQGTYGLVAATAARSLGRFGKEARTAVLVLLESTKADHGAVRREATNALRRINSAAATNSVVQSNSAELRQATAKAGSPSRANRRHDVRSPVLPVEPSRENTLYRSRCHARLPTFSRRIRPGQSQEIERPRSVATPDKLLNHSENQ